MSQSSPESIRSFLIWVLGGVLIVGGAAYLAFNTQLIPYAGSFLPIAGGGVSLISVPFLGRWLVTRENWAMLTAWVFLSLGGAVLVLYISPQQQLVVAFMLGALLTPMVVAYFVNRDLWWLWIPIYILVLAAGYIWLTALHASVEQLISAALFALAVLFWGILTLNKSAVWALIPAVILTIAAALVLLFFSVLQPGTMPYFVVLNSILAAAMLGLWFAARRFDWALWLAVAFGGAAIMSIWFPGPTNWALVALMIGGYLVYRQIRAGRKTLPAASTTSAVAQAAQATTPPAQSQPSASVQAVPVAAPPAARKGPPPGIEFIPLDPLKGRKSDE